MRMAWRGKGRKRARYDDSDDEEPPTKNIRIDEYEQLKADRIELESLRGKHSQLIATTGRQLSLDLSKDETRVENINRKCRPSLLHETYVQLSFQTASNVKSDITRLGGVDDGVWKQFTSRLICSIFMTVQSEMQEAVRTMNRNINKCLQQPVAMYQNTSMVETDPLPVGVADSIMSHQRDRKTAVKTNLKVQDIISRAVENLTDAMSPDDKHQFTGNTLKRMANYFSGIGKPPWKHSLEVFINDVCSLAWGMLLQKPPMTFRTEGLGQKPHPAEHKPLPAKGVPVTDMDEMVVHYFLEPTLTHGDLILETGRVQLRP